MYTYKKKGMLIFGLATMLAFCVGLGAERARAEELSHPSCTAGDGYCLVCDVAEQINSLPEKNEITIDNVAKTTQRIYDIDRIKFDLSDAEYDELTTLVDVGEQYGDVTKYYQAIEGIQSIDEGVNFTITKSFDLGEETVQDIGEAEVAFSVTNVATDQTMTFTMIDLSMMAPNTNMFDMFDMFDVSDSPSFRSAFTDYYEKAEDGNGWAYTYKLPAGTYEITELNTDKAVTINGESRYMVCASMEENGRKVEGNGITVTLVEGESTTLFAMNKAEDVYKVQDEEGHGIPGVRLNSDALANVDEALRTTGDDGSFTVLLMEVVWSDALKVEDAPADYCIPEPIEYELNGDVGEGLTIENSVRYIFTLQLQKHNYKHGKCENCGDEKEGDIHEYKPLVEEVPATCEVGGMKAHYRCTGCEEYFDEDKQAVGYEALQISKLGHDYGALVEEVPATCETGGMKAHYRCARCEGYFDEGKQAVDYEALQISELGHDYGALVEEVPATCEAGGMKAYYRCARCEEYFDEDKQAVDYEALQISELGHDYGALVEEVPATCEAGGMKAYYRCARCEGYFDENKQAVDYEALKINALGHDYGAWTETKAPTETEKGEKEKVCSRCGDSVTEEIPVKVGADYEILVIACLSVIAMLTALIVALVETRRK